MDDDDHHNQQYGQGPKVAVVGPCGSGKSTLMQNLQAQGYNIRAVSQEHSYVAAMWQRLTKPDLLIYLDVTLKSIAKRRTIHWGQERLDQLNHRLRQARIHCDFYLTTDDLTAQEVAEQVKTFLETHRNNPQNWHTYDKG